MPKRKSLFGILALLTMVAMLVPLPGVAVAAGQTQLAGNQIPQFVDPIPKLDVAGGTIQTIVAGTSQIELDMKEFKANMLPHTFVPTGGDPSYTGTYVWGYVKPGTNLSTARDTYTGPVIVATRGVPTEIKYVNNLGTTGTTNVLAYKNSTDQSLHWANPNGVDRYNADGTGNSVLYSGAIPAAVHLHGGEVPAAIDGGPDSWFTSAGQHGPAFYSKDGNTSGNYAIYRYPNVQEAAPLWFHDHTLGATRLNVYAGLAGGYVLTDPKLQLPAGLSPIGLQRTVLIEKAELLQQILSKLDGLPEFPRNGAFREKVRSSLADLSGSPDAADFPQQVLSKLTKLPEFPKGAAFWSKVLLKLAELRGLSKTIEDPLIPLVIQDRMFDTNGQLYFPNEGINPEHPYWIPEFLGDTIAVNGKVWPYLEVKAQRYRFLLINGSNARSYELTFQGNTATPTIWQIGTDQGYLDKPVAVNPLVVMPGERADFIIDFSGLAPGTTLILNNLGPDEPFNGITIGNIGAQDPSDPVTTGKVMQFKIVGGAAVTDSSFNPALSGATIRKGGDTIVRLVNPVTGTLAKQVQPDLTRELTLNEEQGEGGPLEILINNTRWTGRLPDTLNPNNMMTDPDQSNWTPDGLGNYLSETPKEGTTEVWEIVNMTMDAHPIHTHLAQFQLLNRQNYGAAYLNAYAAAFPSGVYLESVGPPLSYGASTASGGKYGGNPDITPYLTGAATPPNPNEAGWKDTIMAPPGMVTRIVVRWAPTDLPAAVPSNSAALRYAFLPNDAIPGKVGANFDYVWHCHIVDHEDNEMMRPDAVIPNPKVPLKTRVFQLGRDY